MVRLLTLIESAQFLGCAPTSLVSRRWREHLGLPAIKIGRSLMFAEKDLQRVISSRREGTPKGARA